MFFTVPQSSFVLCPGLSLSFISQVSGESVAFLLFKAGQNGTILVTSFLWGGWDWGSVSLCSSSCKAGGSASFSSSSEAAPTPLGSGVPFHFAPFRLCSFFSQWQLLYVRRHKEPKMSFRCLQTSCCSGFEIPFHLPHVWGPVTLWLMIVLCLTCCWIFLKNTFFIFH